MSLYFQTALIGLLAGVFGTGLGGVAAALIRRPKKRLFSVVLGFSGGIMLSIVAFDLMPEAFRVGGTRWAVLGLISGVLLIALADLILPHMHFFSQDRESSRFIRAGALVGLGISMHNLPEGLAIGASYECSSRFGLSIAMLMAIQNFPEGMAMGAPMILGGMRGPSVALLAALAGLPMGLGAFLGQVFGTVSEVFLSVSLGFAAGAMLFITVDELVPGALELQEGHSAIFGIVSGVMTGIIVSQFIATI
ncbi:MAG: ZIP family metal transporter [Bacillota bacterium]|jgi:ZIP family zinc transporter